MEEEPAVISQENRLQNHPQKLRRTRMKWTKEMNTDIIRCYFNTILRIPDQPYRREFYNRWVRLYPENRLTEQRICDQQRLILRKSNTLENTRGSWLTEMEIADVRTTIANDIGGEINNEPVVNNDEEDQQADNIGENTIEEPVQDAQQILPNQQQNGEDFTAIQEIILVKYAEVIITPMEQRFSIKKPKSGNLKSLEKSVREVNKALENTPLLTEIIDITQLDDVVYAASLRERYLKTNLHHTYNVGRKIIYTGLSTWRVALKFSKPLVVSINNHPPKNFRHSCNTTRIVSRMAK